MVETSVPQTSNQNFFGAMLLQEQDLSDLKRNKPRAASSTATSLFTIDSILAPRPSASQIRSPVVHHPLHLSHLAAASGFGTHSEFLGELYWFEYLGKVLFVQR